MFVGHALLAFALVAVLGDRLGWERSLTLRVAVLAGLFATVPDVDIAYAPVGMLASAPELSDLASSFWAAGNRVHRGVTHSLVVGAVTALAVGLLARDGSDRSDGVSARSDSFSARTDGRSARTVAGLAVLGGLVALTGAVSGALGAAVALLFVVCAVGLVAVADRLRVPARATTGAAIVGLLSHPFGDLLTGSPPAMLYPFDVALVADRVGLAGSPTLDLLGAFWVELAMVWFAAAAYLWLTDRRIRDHVHRRAAVGVAYGVAAIALPAPTLETSYHFVFSVLGVGMVAVVPVPRSLARPRGPQAVVTALATVTVASVAYAVMFVTL